MRTTTLSVLAFLLVGFTVGTVHTANAAPVSVTEAVNLIRGRVITTDGKPVTEAIVSIMVAGQTDPVVTTRTDVDGNYEITLPTKPGSYSLRVISLGFTPVMLPVSGSGNVPAEIQMRSFLGA